MRPLLPAVVIVAALAAGGCTTTRDDGSPKVQTTAEADRENLKGVAKAPLRDVNLLRTKIPDVLLEAMADPYSRPSSGRCPELMNLIQPLDEALGPDLDLESVEEGGLLGKGRDTMFGAMAGAATDAIPFRSWVRKLSGAERHDHYVQAAITAGAVRRAYLKGLGESKGCNPPATPSHTLAGTPVITQQLKPLYPVRR
jgi:hypothetical protein